MRERTVVPRTRFRSSARGGCQTRFPQNLFSGLLLLRARVLDDVTRCHGGSSSFVAPRDRWWENSQLRMRWAPLLPELAKLTCKPITELTDKICERRVIDHEVSHLKTLSPAFSSS